MSRQGIVDAANASVAHNASFLYGEVRPIPLQEFVKLMEGTLPENQKVETDCSGLATCCYYRAGEPDPNGLDYNGDGFTGTLLKHLKHIPVDAVVPGDLVVLGEAPGKHVVIVVGIGTDPLCVSHGHPGDPHAAVLSTFLEIGAPTALRGVPVPKRRGRIGKAKWVVTGDDGHIIGIVRGKLHTRWMWEKRHRRLVKNQKRKIHYDHVPTDRKAP